MKNKKKAITFAITAIVFAVSAVLTGSYDTMPDWFVHMLDILSAVFSGLGIAVILPNKSEFEGGSSQTFRERKELPDG